MSRVPLIIPPPTSSIVYISSISFICSICVIDGFVLVTLHLRLVCFALVGFILFVGGWLGVSRVIVQGHGIILVLVVWCSIGRVLIGCRHIVKRISKF